jgi:iron-sulfur cluster repair protein YtfE (RIC family)
MNGYQSTNCEALVQRLDAEHEAVRMRLARLHELLAQCTGEGGPCGMNVRTEMAQLYDELRRHFQEEETGGCLEEAACRCPSLSHEVSRLEAEHRELLAQLERLMRPLSSASEPVVLDDFAAFEASLRAHEVREDRVVRHGFNIA